MVTKFGKCSDSMTKEEFGLWMRTNRKNNFEDVIAKIVDFYKFAHPDEKIMMSNEMANMDFWKEELLDVKEDC